MLQSFTPQILLPLVSINHAIQNCHKLLQGITTPKLTGACNFNSVCISLFDALTDNHSHTHLGATVKNIHKSVTPIREVEKPPIAGDVTKVACNVMTALSSMVTCNNLIVIVIIII